MAYDDVPKKEKKKQATQTGGSLCDKGKGEIAIKGLEIREARRGQARQGEVGSARK
jgi:hypothetical protein